MGSTRLLSASLLLCCGVFPQGAAPVPAPVVVTFGNQPQNLAAAGWTQGGCGLNPVAYSMLNVPQGVPFLAWVWSTPTGQCQILAADNTPEPRQRMIPLYTSAGLFTMTRATDPPTNGGDDLWCMVNPPALNYAVRLIQPAAVVEARSQVQAFAVSALDAFGQPLSAPTAAQLVPLAAPPLWTVMGPTPQPGANPWASYVEMYPMWSASDDGCSGNPSVAFAGNSLGTGESRDAVQVLVVF